MRACTIVTRSYLAYARVLARSFAAHHPGRRLTVLVTDDERAEVRSEPEPFDVLRPSDLPLAGEDFRDMARIYDAKELATALKPWLLRRLLDEGADAVIFLDPEMEVLAPIDDLAALARAHQIVLSPQTLRPVPLDGLDPTELDFERVGIYNGGLVGVSPKAIRFLDWHAERLRTDCRVDWARGLYVDQRWLDLVPAYFDHHVLRDPGLNVGNWNLHERQVVQRGTGFGVGDTPLRIFHFGGFDPHRPHRIANDRHQNGSPLRAEAVATDAVRVLCRRYAARLLGEGYDACRRIPYAYPRPARAREGRRLRLLSRLLVPDRAHFEDLVRALRDAGGEREREAMARLRSLEDRVALAGRGSCGIAGERGAP